MNTELRAMLDKPFLLRPLPHQTVLRRILLVFAVAQLGVACSPGTVRDNSDVDLAILTLNLHAYQELQTAGAAESDLTGDHVRQRIERYEPILDRIAAGIIELDPDIICFQEVGEWSNGVQGDPGSVEFGATDTNMVHQVLTRLGDTNYYYTMDWSHYSWDIWLEGSAILSKYPIEVSDSRFIGAPETGRYESWKSRNVPMAKLDVPAIGGVTVFSVHTGWWDDQEEPAQGQYERLLSWAQQVRGSASTVILCGDFNAPAGGPGYQFLTSNKGYSDQYLRANPGGMFDATIGGGAEGWENHRTGQRIDFIFMNEDSPLEVVQAGRVFTENVFGRVSDHVGVYARFTVTRNR